MDDWNENSLYKIWNFLFLTWCKSFWFDENILIFRLQFCMLMYSNAELQIMTILKSPKFKQIAWRYSALVSLDRVA